MPEFNIKIEGIKGDAVERFAALANKTAEDLILEWIKDKVDHVTVQALRAEGKPWEAIAEVLGNSTTQARRIYAQGIDMPLVSKDTIRILERYVDLIERAAEVKLAVPSDEELNQVQRYLDMLPDTDYDSNNPYPFPVPSQEDLDQIKAYLDLLPSEEDLEPLREYQKFRNE